MTKDNRRSKIDRTQGSNLSNIPKGDYRFVFSSDVHQWCGKRRVREQREIEEREIDQQLQTNKKAYHRSMPSIGA